MTTKWPEFDSYADTPDEPVTLVRSRPKARAARTISRTSKTADYAKMSFAIGVIGLVGGAAFFYWKYQRSQARQQERLREIETYRAMQQLAMQQAHAPQQPRAHSTSGLLGAEYPWA